MKKLLIAVCMLGSLGACEKEQFHSIKVAPEAHEEASVATIKMEANTKEWNYCDVKSRTGTVIANGKKCSGEGDECGRKDYCLVAVSSGPVDDIVFDNLTAGEFMKMWNTEEGHDYLKSKGFYETEY